MKLHTKIISILLVAGLASAAAQSTNNFYVKGSVGEVDLGSKGSLHELFKSSADLIAGTPGINMKLDSSMSFSLEGGMFYGENFSFGFEWTMFNADKSSQTDFTSHTAAQRAAINKAFGLSGADEFFGEIANFKEDIDLDRFMFVFNYEHFFTDQFSLLINTGLGVLNVEQEIKAVQVTKGTKINSKADKTTLAYQFGLSLGYHFNENLALYGGARYLGGSDAKFKHKTFQLSGFDTDAYVYELGASFSF